MALFRLGASSENATFIRGEGVYLRPAEMRDYIAWAELRQASRAFLTPWEPTWPADDLARAYLRINGEWRDHVLYAMVETDRILPGRSAQGG